MAGMDREEGDVVASRIGVGRLLVQLRPLARRNWEQMCLGRMHIHPRVARRYVCIAERWPIGLPESDLLPRLPVDLIKLEWLSRVPSAELRALLERLDCKKAGRKQVIDAVRELLPALRRAGRGGENERAFQRLLCRVTEVIACVLDEFRDPDCLDRVCAMLEEGLRRIREARATLHAGRLCRRLNPISSDGRDEEQIRGVSVFACPKANERTRGSCRARARRFPCGAE
jgi:hypothetical protein